MPRHLITDVDPKLKRGLCAVCGPVIVYSGSRYRGKQYWTCATTRRNDESVRMLRKYGITLDEFGEMFAAQGGKCARCDTPASELKIRLSVDHCHKTGVVRKLLCAPCNTYLGKLEVHRHRLEQDLLYLDTGSFEPVPIDN